MDLSFFPLTLDAIDQAAAESLCLFIASDERPLTGLAGLCDWRLSGKLSQLLRKGLLSGDAGEAVLTPAGVRLGFQKLFLFGVGPSDQSDESLVQHLAEALRKLGNAGVREAAMQLPARLSPEVGVRTLVDELHGPEKTLLFAADPQKLVSALSQAARSVPPAARPSVRIPTPQQVMKVPAPGVRVQPRTPTPTEVPRAAPLPAAPDLPKAAPLPSAPLPSAPLPDVPVAPVVESEPPPAQKTEPSPKPPLPPPQRYVPPPPKPSVFDRKKKR